MTVWDLSRLRYTVRKLSGKFDLNQLPDGSPTAGAVSTSNPPGVDDYINDFYLYDMPEHLRTLKLRQFYTFTTVPNCGTYNIPQSIFDIYPPLYIDNYQFNWFQDPTSFYRVWPELNFVDHAIATTDGINREYTFTLTQAPIQQGSVVIGVTPNQDGVPSVLLETFRDQDQPIPLDIPQLQFFVNPGNLTSNQKVNPIGILGTGEIDYLSGLVTIRYVDIPPAGLSINAHYHPYVASRSRDALFWQQQLFIRPIPNDSYLVKVMAYMMPTTVLSAATNATVYPALKVDLSNPQPSFNTVTIQGFNNVEHSGTGPGNIPVSLRDLPQFNEWWQLISYGAAIKILIEEGDYEEADKIKPIFEEQKLLAQRKTLRQLGAQRIQTKYSEDQLQGCPTWPIFPMY